MNPKISVPLLLTLGAVSAPWSTVSGQSSACPILDQFRVQGRRPEGSLHWNPDTRRLYLLTGPLLVWDAIDAASRHEGHLVSINDAIEQAWLVSEIGGASPYWIGLRRARAHGPFRWLNGDALGFTNWEPTYAEPNDGYCTDACPGEPYAVMNWLGAGLWNDVTANPLTDVFQGIVEIEAPLVCVRVEGAGPMGSGRMGHAWLTLDPNNGLPPISYGFYPSGNPHLLLPGAIHDDSSRPFDAELCYVVSRWQFERIVARILTDHSLYTVFGDFAGGLGYNCTSWAAAVLAAGGIELPTHSAYGIASPEVLLDSIRALGGCAAAVGLTSSGGSAPVAPSFLGEMELAFAEPATLAALLGLSFLDESLGSLDAGPGAPVTLVVDHFAPERSVIAVDWGDGARQARLGSFVHAYAAAGSYPLTLVTVDEGAVRRVSGAIHVVDGAGASTSFLPVPYSGTSGWVNLPATPPQGALELASTRSLDLGCDQGPSLSASLPRIGREFSMFLSGTAPFSLVTISLGDPAKIRAATGCSPAIGHPVFVRSFQTDAAGIASHAFTIPDSLALIGLELVAQARVWGYGGRLSEALLLRLGQ